VQRIVRQANGSVRLGDAGNGALLLAQFCMDDRGLWLQVGNGIRGIHVNGRPVRRMALLRAGDAVYVDGVEMVLQGEVESLLQAPAPKNDDGSDEQQRLLRGVGGLHHGRSFTLSRTRLVGRGGDADIEINEPAFAEQHARVEVHGERVLLRDLGSAGSCWKYRMTHADARCRMKTSPARTPSRRRCCRPCRAGSGAGRGCWSVRCCWPRCSACCSGSARADLLPLGLLW